MLVGSFSTHVGLMDGTLLANGVILTKTSSNHYHRPGNVLGVEFAITNVLGVEFGLFIC